MSQQYLRVAVAASLAASLVLLLNGPCFGIDSEAILAELRAGRESAIQSIRTLSCTVQVESDPPDYNKRSAGAYWRSDGLVRVRERLANGFTIDLVSKEGIAWTFTRPEADPSNLAGAVGQRGRTGRLASSCDAWRYLIDFEGIGWNPVGLGTLLDSPSEKRTVRKVTEHGRTLIHLELHQRHPDQPELLYKKEYWFDPDVNYMWRKTVYTPLPIGPGNRIENEILGFVEPKPGIFIPRGRHIRYYKRGELLSAGTTMLDQVKVNEPISTDVFTLRFPYGLTLLDRIDLKKYRVDEFGKPIEFIANLDPERVSAKSEERTSSHWKQTASESWNWKSTLVWVSTALVLVFAMYVVYQRVRVAQ
jgi:hypothetical protein